MSSFQDRYSSIEFHDGEETQWLKKEGERRSLEFRSNYHRFAKKQFQILIYIIVSLLFLGLGVLIGFCGTIYRYQYGHVHSSVPENLLNSEIYNDILFPSQPHRFNGSFFKLSQYAGSPTPQLDAAWSKWTETGNKLMPAYPALMRISRSDFEKTTSHSIETAVQFEDAEDKSEGYVATFEMYHQLHCLDMIRKFIHWDYYKEHDSGWADSKLLREHSDHCLSMLLDVLFCRSDTALVTYHWVKGFKEPIPDFSTLHSCRDPEAVLNWTREHEVFPLQALHMPEGHAHLKELF